MFYPSGGETLKKVEMFKYLGYTFTSDGQVDKDIDNCIAKAGVVVNELHPTLVGRAQTSRQAKLAVFKSLYYPTLTYGHES